jgi:PKD repeat protein
MRPLIHFYVTIVLFSAFSFSSQAQISQGGTPPSFKSTLFKSAISEEILPNPEVSKLLKEDRFNDSIGMPYRLAYMIPVNICMDYSGTWDSLSTGEKIWRLKITAPSAAGLYLVYDNLYLPKGSKLFLYNEDKQFVIGAFTEQNNHPSHLFATEIVPGESCILEYVSSNQSNEKPSLCISKVAYVYRGMAGISPTMDKLKSAGSCEVNVLCSPEGDNWKDVRRAVAKVLMNGYECSGNLLNNTAQDFRNLFSIAFHCVTGNESTAPTWVFYFNYEQTACSNNSNISTGNTVIGANILAKTPLQGGGDGVLLELTSTIPAGFNPYWAGWDMTDTLIAGGVCISHPSGDVKKISTLRSFWQTNTWIGDSTVGAPGAHWDVIFSATPNGHGVTEGGSSGSGLFGPDERFRGSLSGGTSSCSVLNGDNMFGKLAYNWNRYGTTSATQFKTWLDPLNTGLKKINGIDHNPQNGAFWTSSPPLIEMDSSVTFRDESTFNPTAWLWTFPGGDPSTSNLSNPVVRYKSSGLYDVSLKVTNANGTFTKARTSYVYVRPPSAWRTQNSHFSNPTTGIGGFSIVDSLIVWAWGFDGLNTDHQIMGYTRTINGGNTWKADSIVSDTLKGFGIGHLFAINKDTVYAAIFGPAGGGHIVVTKNGGATWQIQNPTGFKGPDGFPNFVYFFDKNNGICGGDPNNGYFEVYNTTNSGNTWTRVPTGNIPAILSNETGTTDFYDAVGDTIWFGTSNGRVFRSIDKGNNWTVANTGLSGRIDVKFRNAKTGFAIQNGARYLVKKTINGGSTWTNYAQPDNFIQGTFAYVPQSNATWINVGFGSAYSSDDGVTYNNIDNDVIYTAVKFYNEFIGWAGGYNIDSLHFGIYKWNRTNKALTSVKDNSGLEEGGKFQIFPNPTQGILNISNAQLKINELTITLRNIQGAEVKKEKFQNLYGEFHQTLDINGLSPGMYFVIIQTGNNVETHKVVLIK